MLCLANRLDFYVLFPTDKKSGMGNQKPVLCFETVRLATVESLPDFIYRKNKKSRKFDAKDKKEKREFLKKLYRKNTIGDEF